MSEAARQDDPLAHSSALGGLLLGMAVGAAIALATVSTGGLAAVAIVGAAASGGAVVGEILGSLSVFSSDTGHISSGSPNIYTNGRPAARSSLSTVLCTRRGHGPNLVAEGSVSVYINGMPASRVGDHSACGGKISAGSSNVFIGGATVATEEVASEVPEWLHGVVFALGLGSGVGLGLLRVVAWRTLGRGLAGGAAGGGVGHWAGGEIFGEGSDGQKLATLGGAIIGSWAAIRGGQWFKACRQARAQGTGLRGTNSQSNLPKRGQNFPNLPKEARDKIPPDWAETANKKGIGSRFGDPSDKGNGIRIDQGNVNSPQPSQQVDHVVIRSNGVVIGRDGKPINGTIKNDFNNAHIPLTEWMGWRTWNTPR